MTTSDRIKDLETQLGVLCLTKPAGLNQTEPNFYEFLVIVSLHIPEVRIKISKDHLNIRSVMEEIVKQTYVVGFNSGTEFGNKQIVNKFKTLFKI